MKKLFSILIISFYMIGCKSPTEPGNNIDTDNSQYNLNNILFTQVSYDTLVVQTGDSIISNKKVVKIYNGEIIDDNFIVKDSLDPIYERHGNKTSLKFGYVKKMPDTAVYYDAGVRFLFKDNTRLFVHRKIFTLGFPYVNTKLLYKSTDFIKSEEPVFQPYNDIYSIPFYDFAFAGNEILFTKGNLDIGLFEFNFNFNETKLLFHDELAYHFDINSENIFVVSYNLTSNRKKVFRINIQEGSVDKSLALSINNPLGLAVLDTSVYIISGEGSRFYLMKLSNSLNVIRYSSINGIDFLGAAAYQNFLYSIDQGYLITQIDPENSTLSIRLLLRQNIYPQLELPTACFILAIPGKNALPAHLWLIFFITDLIRNS